MDPNGWHVNKVDWSNIPGNIGNFYYNQFDYNYEYALHDYSDFKPENGWELIKQDFGYSFSNSSWNGTTLSSQNVTSTFPYYILYNKFSAKLRVMAAMQSQISIGGKGIMTLRILKSPYSIGGSAANLDGLFVHHGRFARGLDKTTLTYQVNAPIEVLGTNSEFVFADYQLAYDPCVCFFKSGLELSINKVADGTITASGNLIASNTDLIDVGSLFGENLTDPYYSGMDNDGNSISGIIDPTAVNQYYKNALKFKTAMNNANNNVTDDGLDYLLSAVSFIGGFAGSVGEYTEDPGLKFGGEVISKVADFVSTQYAGENGNINNKPQPIVLTGALKLSGTIHFDNVINGHNVYIALPIGKNILMANDVPEIMGKTNENENRSKISIIADNKEEADKLFSGLSAGGQIEMPIGDSPWGSYFGMFRDKYGIEWMVDFDPSYKPQH